jgi:hypothetical protein
MQKLFRLTALLVAAMLAVWVVGCGDDDDDDDDDTGTVAAVTAVNPADNSTVAANTAIEVTFDNAPEDSVTINGKPATLVGKKASIDNAGLAEGANIPVEIKWTSTSGDAGTHTVTYTVEPEDVTPPSVASSTPSDGAKDVNPDDVNADGIVIELDEEADVTLTVTLEDVPLNWKASVDGTTVTLQPLSGSELGFEKEYVVTGTATDGAGNEAEISITFTTQGKE